MYLEGGSSDAGGTLEVREPHPYCTTNLRNYDRRHDLVPLERVVRMPRDECLATPRQTYSQSCMQIMLLWWVVWSVSASA
jgi:hypothetical protein